MRVALITSKKSAIDPTEVAAAQLKSQVVGIEVSRKVAINNIDIFREINACSDFDAVCVVVYYEDSSPDIEAIVQKLIGLEVNGTHVLSFVEKLSDQDEEEQGRLIAQEIIGAFVRK